MSKKMGVDQTTYPKKQQKLLGNILRTVIWVYGFGTTEKINRLNL